MMINKRLIGTVAESRKYIAGNVVSVSYTHLDVYKRQVWRTVAEYTKAED